MKKSARLLAASAITALAILASAAAAQTTQPGTSKSKPTVWPNGAAVEVKWGGLWKDGRIINRRGEWLMVEYTQGKFIEWVEPWRLRKPGSTEEIPYASPNGMVKKTDPPPRATPGEAPDYEKPADGNADPFAPAPFDFPVTPADMKGVKRLAGASAEKWSYTAGAAPTSKSLARPITTQGPMHNGAGVTGFHRAGGTAMIGYALGSGDSKGTSVELIDLVTAKSRRLKLDTATRPTALTPNGKRLVGRADGFHTGTMHRVDVWDVTGAEAKHVVSFVPHQDADGKAADVKSLTVIDDEHVITGSGETITCWKIDGARAVWSFDAGRLSNASVALSTDRKTIAIAVGRAIYLLEAATGNLVGSITDGVPHVTDLAFDPTGKRLFGQAAGGVAAFDLTAGTALPIVAMGGVMRVEPLSERLVDVGVAVIDFDRAAFVAKLERPGNDVRSLNGALMGLVTEGKDTKLCAWPLPIAELESRAKTAKSGNAISLKKGAALSLDIALPADVVNAEQIVRDLRTNLEKAGLQVKDGAPLRLVARVEDGKSEERMYESHFSRDRERVKVTVTEKVTRLWIEADGKPVWQMRESAWPSMFVDRKEGQSIEEAVRAASKPSVDFLRHVTLPGVVLTDDAAGVPTLKLTAAGVK